MDGDLCGVLSNGLDTRLQQQAGWLQTVGKRRGLPTIPTKVCMQASARVCVCEYPHGGADQLGTATIKEVGWPHRLDM